MHANLLDGIGINWVWDSSETTFQDGGKTALRMDVSISKDFAFCGEPMRGQRIVALWLRTKRHPLRVAERFSFWQLYDLDKPLIPGGNDRFPTFAIARIWPGIDPGIEQAIRWRWQIL